MTFYSYFSTTHLDLLIVCSVSWWLHSCCHSNSNQGNAITKQVVPLPATPLTLEHLDQHHVQLETLQTHPGEGRQEQEVKESRNHTAQNLYKESLRISFYKLINKLIFHSWNLLWINQSEELLLIFSIIQSVLGCIVFGTSTFSVAGAWRTYPVLDQRDSNDEKDLSQHQGQHQVFVYRVSVTLKVPATQK